MDNSPLQRLPVKLRVYIYELALTQDSPLEFRYDLCSPELHSGTFLSMRGDKSTGALTRTSRQLRAEALPVLYSSNALVLKCTLHRRFHPYSEVDLDLLALHNTLKHIEEARPTKVDLTVDFGNYDIMTLTRERDLPGVLIHAAWKMDATFTRGSMTIKIGLEHLPQPNLSDKLRFTIDSQELYSGFWTIHQSLKLQTIACPIERLWLSAVSSQFNPNRVIEELEKEFEKIA